MIVQWFTYAKKDFQSVHTTYLVIEKWPFEIVRSIISQLDLLAKSLVVKFYEYHGEYTSEL